MSKNPQNIRGYFWASLGAIAVGAILSPALAVKAEGMSISGTPLIPTQSSS